MTTDQGTASVSVIIPAYRDAERAITLVRSLEPSRQAGAIALEIVVVDDGSGDGSAARIADALGESIVLHRLPANRGRAIARNEGARTASGTRLLFLDCDCLPADEGLVAAHLRAWTPGTVATIGPVTGNGGGFWDCYQRDASERRARQHAAGHHYSGSSQNLMVDREAFDACGGFDPEYRAYGFEDRDLQLRLGKAGCIRWAADAVVRHMDDLSLRGVCAKMAEAGGDSAIRFARRHPDAYDLLGYAALDARRHRWLLPVARLGDLLLPSLAAALEPMVESRLPYALRHRLVKSISALAYLAGTSRAPDPAARGRNT